MVSTFFQKHVHYGKGTVAVHKIRELKNQLKINIYLNSFGRFTRFIKMKNKTKKQKKKERNGEKPWILASEVLLQELFRKKAVPWPPWKISLSFSSRIISINHISFFGTWVSRGYSLVAEKKMLAF
jgi:hypothetical protein